MDTGSASGDRDSEAGRRESASHASVQPSATSSILSSASEPITTLEPLRSATSSVESRRAKSEPSLKRTLTDDELVLRALSHRRNHDSTQDGSEDWAQIQRLMSRMFGKERRASSDEEKTRHAGVIWKNLTVKGTGLGAALQPTIADIFLALPRLIGGVLTCGRKGTGVAGAPIRTILDGFSGCVRPGEMLLVLGRPGSGCSTFLKVISNQRSGYKSVDGDVRYGGTAAKEMARKYRSEVLYNPEDDLHYATLTVRDTLLFALKARTPDKASRLPGESREEYQQAFLSAIAKLFWIEHALDTKVGNEMIRGVSGGEKKRVSIGEAMVTKASVQCWDNSTRGLDASTALEYVQSLRSLTNTANVSTLVALYQASENLYSLFDKVILIEKGKCAYFGRAEDAKAYFEGLGFECPPRWTTPDFLTTVSDSHARRVRSGWEDRIPRSAEEFQKAYRASETFKAALADISEFEKEIESETHDKEQARREKNTKNFTIPFYEQVMILTWRQFLVMFGDRQSLAVKWGVVTFQALIIGSLFYNLPKTSAGVFTRGGVMFFILLFNSLLALAELTAAFQSRPILLKHKSFSFYRPSAYALAQTVVDVPLVFIQIVIFNIIVYFMSNLSRTPSQFFISLLFIFMLTMTMYAFFRAIGSLSSSLDNATRVTGVAIQALVVYTGYLIPPWKMHPWLKWLIWLNPVQYCFEALMGNEFYDLNIQCVPPYVVPEGPNTSPSHQGCAIQGSDPNQLVVRGSSYINSAFTYTRAHLWRNLGIVVAWFVFFVALTMLGMEMQKPNKGGSAVTVFQRGEAPETVQETFKHKKHPADVETGEKDGARNDLSDESGNGEGMVEGIARNTSILTWQDVNYTIPYKGGEKKLLQGIQGYVKPGRLTAMMGASGAGKTTLLNTLAQRISFGVVTGDFLVDGKPLPKSFQRTTGFAEQMDIHEPTATVRESLQFSALLRQPQDVPIKDKYEYCEKIIDLLEMRPIAGAIVGTTGSGLNQEQRKRLTIAVELASKPELLLFLDEPTSGLDSLAAFNIVRFLRRLADAGQAILCTIHQPSAVLFEQFDDLLLLQTGGRVVYNGELGQDSGTMLDYFQRNGGRTCGPHENPAEYMLEVIGGGNPDYKGQNWADVWGHSPEYAKISSDINNIIQSRRASLDSDSSDRPGDDDHEFAMPLWAQIMATTRRSFIAYWRTPEYALGKFLLHIFTGLFNTFTFWHVGESYIDMQSRLFSVFMTLTISPPLIQQLQPRYLHFRSLYESRESNSKIYSWVAFVTSTVLPELPYSIVAGSIYFNCWYWGTWFPRDSFRTGFTWLFLMLFEMYYIGLGQFIAALSPNELFASLLIPCFFTFIVSFCGVVVPYQAMTHFWKWWMYWLTPFHYLLEGLLGVIVHEAPVRCIEREEAAFTAPPNSTCEGYSASFAREAGGYVYTASDGLCRYCQFADGDQFARNFNVFYSNKWRDYGIFWVYVLFNFIVVFLFSWGYLHGVQKLTKRISKWKTRKSRKSMKA